MHQRGQYWTRKGGRSWTRIDSDHRVADQRFVILAKCLKLGAGCDEFDAHRARPADERATELLYIAEDAESAAISERDSRRQARALRRSDDLSRLRTVMQNASQQALTLARSR
jgi:hypothetical protein